MNRMKYLLTIMTLLTGISLAQPFIIVRVHYSGGGDWYGDPSSLPNLLNFIEDSTTIKVDHREPRLRLTDDALFNYPYLYLTGHGNILFSDEEAQRLREYLLRGGFLHADDNYGMDASFRAAMAKVFPDKEWVELPFNHPIYHSYYDFPNGLPKVHEHDGKPPQGLGLFDGDRLMVFYTYECDLGDGWEDAEVHHDPYELRLAALKMGVNIVVFALTQ